MVDLVSLAETGVPSAIASTLTTWLIRGPGNPLVPARSDRLSLLAESSSGVRATFDSLETADRRWFARDGNWFLIMAVPFISLLVVFIFPGTGDEGIVVTFSFAALMYGLVACRKATSLAGEISLQGPALVSRESERLSQAHHFLESAFFLQLTQSIVTVLFSILLYLNPSAPSGQLSSAAPPPAYFVGASTVILTSGVFYLFYRTATYELEDCAFGLISMMPALNPNVRLTLTDAPGGGGILAGRLVGIGRTCRLQGEVLSWSVPWYLIKFAAAEPGSTFLFDRPHQKR
jgi:hypothetical protein